MWMLCIVSLSEWNLVEEIKEVHNDGNKFFSFGLHENKDTVCGLDTEPFSEAFKANDPSAQNYIDFCSKQ